MRGSEDPATATATAAYPGTGRPGLPGGADDGTSVDPIDPGRTVIGRIALITDAFDERDAALSLADLSRRTDLPKSTVHRLAEQLRTLGWLERDHRGYRIGMRLFELGGLAAQSNQLRENALPHLHALASATGLAVQLGVLDIDEVVYLDRVVTDRCPLPTRLGGRMPAYCTGLGKAMLAFDDAAADALLDHPLIAHTRHTITDAGQFRSVLSEVRSSGVAFDREESYEGLACVAAPIRNAGRAIGAVSVAGPIEEFDAAQPAAAVRQTAVRIWEARFNRRSPTRFAPDPARRYAANLARTLPRPAMEAS